MRRKTPGIVGQLLMAGWVCLCLSACFGAQVPSTDRAVAKVRPEERMQESVFYILYNAEAKGQDLGPLNKQLYLYMEKFADCYMTSLKDPRLEETFTKLTWTLNEAGAFTHVKVDKATPKNARLGKCFIKTLKAIQLRDVEGSVSGSLILESRPGDADIGKRRKDRQTFKVDMIKHKNPDQKIFQ